jgi:hypothetical protein
MDMIPTLAPATAPLRKRRLGKAAENDEGAEGNASPAALARIRDAPVL